MHGSQLSRERLCTVEMRLQEPEENSDLSGKTEFVASNNFREQSLSKPSISDKNYNKKRRYLLKCYQCGLRGHLKRDCATQHMIMQRYCFSTFENFQYSQSVLMGNGQSMKAFGKGNIGMHVGVKWVRNYLQDVWFVLEAKRNLFLVSPIVDEGVDIIDLILEAIGQASVNRLIASTSTASTLHERNGNQSTGFLTGISA
ncbi:hypothetical protein JTB14_017826 [Gonioctena quinquepunctata]|nr:hypothetical protein JTB14_017826 [Gonioctena quinquepunctata]